MVCERCSGKGFIEYETQRDGRFVPIVQQCCDIEKYSLEVKKRMKSTPDRDYSRSIFKVLEGGKSD